MLLLFVTLKRLQVGTRLKGNSVQFLGNAAKILHMDHRPHDYNPVLTVLGLSDLTDKRVSVDPGIHTITH